MYAEHRLDTPPPRSQFRRPWSPDPYDPLPRTDDDDDHEHPQYQYQHQYHHQQRREPSDVSVEALDLADFARTLPQRTADPYPAFYPYDRYTPAPLPLHPLASRDSLHPPSLVSRGGTNSTQSHPSSRTSRTSRRPFSLPPPSHHSETPTPGRAYNNYASNPQVVEPEIDISQFPSWSRGWYDSKGIPKPDYSTPSKAFYDSAARSPFDPAYNPNNSYPWDHLRHPDAFALSSNTSSRDLLPWSSEPTDFGPPVDPETKEERMRMLQREFGPRINNKGGAPFEPAEERPMIGSVDTNGKLVTEGPKKRIATRLLQVALALTAAIPSIYAAIVIKSKGKPPPASAPPAYLLYVLSVLTTFALFYLVFIRPCCGGQRLKSGDTRGGPLANGMMVLPVQSLPGGSGGGQGRKNKKQGGKRGAKGDVRGGDVQVNLIVDPTAFGGRDDGTEEGEDEEDEYGEGSIPGGYDSQRRSRARRRPQRRSVFAGLAMEAQWREARATLKKMFAFDVVFGLLWGAEFVFILIGKRCPTGGFEGWCNAYNVSSAAACLLCVAFGLSTFFDVKDMSSSKVSPRTRT